MPNFCFNDVRFTGSAEGLKNVKRLFQKLADVEECNRVQVAEVFFGKEPQNHFFSIMFWWKDNDFFVSDRTGWTPNVQDMLKIANEFQVSFVHDAFEFNCGIYQRCIYCYAESLYFPKMVQTEFAVYDFDRDSIPYDPNDY